MVKGVDMDHLKKCELSMEIAERMYCALTDFLEVLDENDVLDNNDVINIVCSVAVLMAISTGESEIESPEDMEKAKSDKTVKFFIEEAVKRLKGFISGEEYWGFAPAKYRKEMQN